MYWKAKEFFCSLPQKPEWLNQKEWKVLQFYYLPQAQCEPPRNKILEKAATELKSFFGWIQTREQAYAIAQAALNSGIRKVRNQTESPKYETIEAPAPQLPYWAK